jgi:hypothetical protein
MVVRTHFPEKLGGAAGVCGTVVTGRVVGVGVGGVGCGGGCVVHPLTSTKRTRAKARRTVNFFVLVIHV